MLLLGADGHGVLPVPGYGGTPSTQISARDSVAQFWVAAGHRAVIAAELTGVQMAGRNSRSFRRAERRRMSRPVGCLVWLIILLVLLIVAALMFGGFQKGTKVSAQPAPTAQHRCPCVVAAARGH
jgi:hypothetical protein